MSCNGAQAILDGAAAVASLRAAPGSAATRPRVGVGLSVAHPPVFGFAGHRLAGMYSPAVRDVALVVAVAHQCAYIPTDLVAESARASHCFCTSFSALVANSREGPKVRDGTGVSMASGRPRPRIDRAAVTTAAATTPTAMPAMAPGVGL